MKTRWFLGACLTMLLATSRASATPLYNVTDLGNGGVSFATDASGYTSSITSLATGAAYAFDKAPVTYINERVDGGSHYGSYTQYTMQVGDYKVGYRFDYGGSLPLGYPWYFPSFLGGVPGWSSNSPSGLVNDVNIQGQAVGSMGYSMGDDQRYAAFSAVGLQNHGPPSMDSFNLNNYISSIPGVSLTNATNIDDQGRILATGSDGDTYLLTPTSLDPAQPVPEPAMLTLFGVALACLGGRRAARSFKPALDRS